MTSIEWLISKLGISEITHKKLFEQAKLLHKQDIIDAYKKGQALGFDDNPNYMAEQYYQEAFVSKGSDDHISDISKMVEVPQQEISDEEIEKGAKEWYNKEGAYSASAIALKTWVYAIKWYREQLKQRQ